MRDDARLLPTVERVGDWLVVRAGCSAAFVRALRGGPGVRGLVPATHRWWDESAEVWRVRFEYRDVLERALLDCFGEFMRLPGGEIVDRWGVVAVQQRLL